MPQLITDHSAAPHVVSFVPVGYFQGFIFVGRKDKTRPIDELINEMGAAGSRVPVKRDERKDILSGSTIQTTCFRCD